MRLSFSTKIALLLIVCIVVVSSGIFFTTRYYVETGFNENAISELTNRQKAVQSKLESLKESTLAETYLIASDQILAKAIVDGDTAYLKKRAKDILQKTGIDFLTITDAKGVVVARGHSDQSGDSATGQLAIRQGLAGQSTVGIEEGTVVKLSVRGGAPVMLDGKVVGAVSVGENLGSHAFVDQVKRDMGVECTIFNGDTRESTSIYRDGKRVVGTKMTNPAVVDSVLTKQQVFNDRNIIIGVAYDTVYWPLVLADGKTGGMLFIGKDRASIAAVEEEILLSILAAAGVVGLIMLLVGLVTARKIVRPILTTIGFARNVADGKLDETLSVQRNDEIGDLANALRGMVQAIKGKIAEAEKCGLEAKDQAGLAEEAKARAEAALRRAEAAKAEGMIAAAERIEGVAHGVSVAGAQLAGQIERTTVDMDVQERRTAEAATAMEEMNATVLEVARNASDAARQAARAKVKAQEGHEVVGRAVAAIGQVDSLAAVLTTDMAALGEQARSISGILGVISDIADQTNLLALNAAIEAARAGDAGRGFAVVADEVRKLAEKTMTATKEVGDSIHSIQQGTTRNVDRVKDAAEASRNASDLAGRSGTALEEIVSLVDETTSQVQSIAAAAEEQSAASEEINRLVDEVGRITASTASGMRQSAKAVSDLSGRSEELNEVIASMRGGEQLSLAE